MNTPIDKGGVPLSPEERLLVCASRVRLREGDAMEMEGLLKQDLAWDRVERYSGELGARPLLFKHLNDQGWDSLVPAQLMQSLETAYFNQSLSNLRLYAQLDRVLDALGRAGVSVILLKGALLARWIYGDIGLRPMSDIDILCREADAGRAARELEGLGYAQDHAVHHSPLHGEVLTAHDEHLLPFRKPNAHSIEVHVNLFSRMGRDTSGMESLWDEAVPLEIEGSKLLCLAPHDQMLFHCLHLHRHLTSSCLTLYWFCDIHEMLGHYGEGSWWNVLGEKAASLGATQKVADIFQLLGTHWGTAFPPAAQQLAASTSNPFSMASILRGQSDLKVERVKLLSSYARDLKSIKEVHGLKNRLYFIWRLLVPTRAHLMHRYGVKGRAAAYLCYGLLPFTRLWNMLAGAYCKAHLMIKKRGTADTMKTKGACGTGSPAHRVP